MRIWCKICGVTRVQDALDAQSAGADAIGVNFVRQSPRHIEPAQAARICKAVSMTRVGVFLDPTEILVNAVLDQVELDVLQFHGSEPVAFCERFGKPYIKVLSVQPDRDFTQAAVTFSSAWALLLDTHVGGQVGGTGQTFDWSVWPDIADTRLILAGGLGPDNVAAAIEQTHPFGVDVASGVESGKKGVKDPQMMRDFVEQVRGTS